MERKDTVQNAYRLTGSNNFYDGISVVRFCKTPYGLIALLTYVVLDHTGIGRRHFTGDSQTFQQALNGMVSLLRLPCDDQTFGGEGNDMMCVNSHISFLLKLLEKHADCRSGYPQIPGKISRMNRFLPGQAKNAL